MTDRREMPVRILEQSAEALLRSKDEEYAYWQGRPPYERIAAMLELSFALFGLRGDEPDLRRRMLENPRLLTCPWLDKAKATEPEPKARG